MNIPAPLSSLLQAGSKCLEACLLACLRAKGVMLIAFSLWLLRATAKPALGQGQFGSSCQGAVPVQENERSKEGGPACRARIVLYLWKAKESRSYRAHMCNKANVGLDFNSGS